MRIIFYTFLLILYLPLHSEVNITPISHFAQAQHYAFDAIRISDSILICKSNTGIDIYSISTSSDIHLESHTDIPNPLYFEIHDNFVYVSSWSKDHQQRIFSQIDISDICEPEIIQQLSFNTDERISTFAIFNSDVLFMYETCTNESTNIHIYNLPSLDYAGVVTNMNILGRLNESIGYSFGESLENDLLLWDVTDPFQIEFFQEIDMSSYHEIGYCPFEFIVFSDSLLAASGQTGVSFWNVSDFDNWIYINNMDYPDGFNENTFAPISIDEDLMIVSDNYGLSLYDIGNLNNIIFLDDVPCEGSNSGLNMTSFQIHNEFLYATGYKDGVHIFNYDDLSISHFDDYCDTPTFNYILLQNSLLIACSFEHGVYFYNCDNPEFPELISEYLPYDCIIDIHDQYNKLAVVFLDNNSLYFDLYDVTDSNNITLISTYPLEFYEIIVSANEDWDDIILQNVNYSNQSFRRVSVDQSGSLETIYSYDLPERSFDIYNNIGYYLEYINNNPNVIIIDDLNSNYPEVIATMEIDNNNQDLTFTLNDNLLQFYSPTDNIIFFYEIVNSATLQFLVSLSEPTYGTDGIVLEEHYFGVNGYMSHVYDLSTPSTIVYPINTEYAFYNIYNIRKMIINDNNYAVLNNQGSMEIWQVDTSSSNNDNQIVSLGSNLTNFPNPFNPSTEISFQISEVSEWESAEIIIYNIKGQKVKTLPVSPSQSHTFSLTWDGTDRNNRKVSSGVYLYQLHTDGKPIASRKMMLLK